MARQLLLIGDTISNTTYHARPPAEGDWQVPFAFLNEELLEIEPEHADRPRCSIQGIGYIARALHAAGTRPRVCTSLNGLPDLVRAPVVAAAHAASCVTLPAPAPIVVRVLRNVVFSHIAGSEAAYRPQLRLDGPRGVPGRIEHGVVARLLETLAAGDLCMIRTATADFLAGPPEAGARDDHAARLTRTGARVNELQVQLEAAKLVAVIDLRPIPPNLEILGRDTIVSTTLSRLRAWAAARGIARHPQSTVLAEIEAYFWALGPRALLCFAPDLGLAPHPPPELGPRPGGTVLLVRAADHPARATRQTFPLRSAYPDGGGAGMVIGGDAFVAGYLHELVTADVIDEAALTTAAGRATSTLDSVLPRPLGSVANPASAAPVAAARIEPVARDTVFDRFKHDHLRGISAPEVYFGDLKIIAPRGGKLHGVLTRLHEELEAWKPRPGADLIAIFGESRCGKEYPLKLVLESLGRVQVGPVNMHQFLQEAPKVVKHLRDQGRLFDATCKLGPCRSVLLIDEVVPDDAGRSLLNLTAEKQCRDFEHLTSSADDPADDRNFREFLVVILSSIPRERLLPDLHGRLCSDVVVPPLRERVEEIPYVLPGNLTAGMGHGWTAPDELRVSYRALSAILGHDFRRRPGAERGTGLDQQNFRALQDLLAYAHRRATEREAASSPAVRTIQTTDLPDAIRALAYSGEPDDAGLSYPSPGKAAQIPGHWPPR